MPLIANCLSRVIIQSWHSFKRPSCLPPSFALSRTRFFLLSSSTTATGSSWKPLRDTRRGWEMERERGTTRDTGREKRGRHDRLGCYHMAPKHPHPPLSLMLSPQPRSTAPHTHWPPLHAPLPPPYPRPHLFALHPSLVQTGCSHGGDGDVQRWKHW